MLNAEQCATANLFRRRRKDLPPFKKTWNWTGVERRSSLRSTATHGHSTPRSLACTFAGNVDASRILLPRVALSLHLRHRWRRIQRTAADTCCSSRRAQMLCSYTMSCMQYMCEIKSMGTAALHLSAHYWRCCWCACVMSSGRRR